VGSRPLMTQPWSPSEPRLNDYAGYAVSSGELMACVLQTRRAESVQSSFKAASSDALPPPRTLSARVKSPWARPGREMTVEGPSSSWSTPQTAQRCGK